MGVKARVVNRKQVDVAAWRSFHQSWNVPTVHCTRRGALSETVASGTAVPAVLSRCY